MPGQFFELDVYHSDGTPLTSDQIFTQLEKVWNSSLQTNKEPVGILTSNHRNSWAKAYSTLIKGTHIRPQQPVMLNPFDSERALLAPLHIRENLRWVLLVSSFCSVASCSENASSD